MPNQSLYFFIQSCLLDSSRVVLSANLQGSLMARILNPNRCIETVLYALTHSNIWRSDLINA